MTSNSPTPLTVGLGRETGHDVACVSRIGDIQADHCHWCGPVLTVTPEEAQRFVDAVNGYAALQERVEAAERELEECKTRLAMVLRVDDGDALMRSLIMSEDLAHSMREAAERARDAAQDDVLAVEHDLSVARRLNGELVEAVQRWLDCPVPAPGDWAQRLAVQNVIARIQSASQEGENQ